MGRKTQIGALVAVGAVYLWLISRLVLANPGWVGADAGILDGVAAETLAGTTPGRQALVGSAWWGPLPMVAHLAATALLRPLASAGSLAGVPLAAWLSALCVAWACLWAVRAPSVTDGLKGSVPRPPVLPLTLAAVLPGAVRLAGSGSAEALVFPLALALIVQCGAWLGTGQLRHLVPAAFSMAGLLLCGVAAWGWVLFGAVAMVAGALRQRALARRLPGLLLLGWLPTVYALGVWALLNWLIMTDARFFLRALAELPRPEWSDLRWIVSSPWEQAALVVALGGALLGLLARDGRQVGYGLAGVAAALWLWVLDAYGLGWSGDATRLLLPVCALLSLTRFALAAGVGNPRRGMVIQGALILAILVPLVGASGRQSAARGDLRAGDDATVAHVTKHVRAISPHAKVFVCGYEGLGLLHGDRHGELFVPAMDLHLGDLRRDYWGQTLFALVRRPVGAARMESIVWREPDFHMLGSSRTLHSADFGDWRLYEVVTAPTQRQLMPVR